MEENSGPREMRRPDLAQGQSACPGGPGGGPFENVTVATFVLSKKASKVLRRYSSRDGGLRPSPLESDFTSPSTARKENQTMEFRIRSPQGKQLSVLSEKLLNEVSFVRKGQVLFEIDPRPFRAVLDRAKAQLAQSEARVDTERLRHLNSQFQARGCDAIVRPLLFRLIDRIRPEAESFALHSWQMV
jgi:multidrug efflux pump subunit AcrA (membrane-fusion protein)